MSISTIFDRMDTPAINAQCSTCMYWDADFTPTYANIAGRRVQVAQCLCEEDDAPRCEVSGPFDGVVFVHAECRCRAYEAHPDALADATSSQAHYADLDRQLTRDAWM